MTTSRAPEWGLQVLEDLDMPTWFLVPPAAGSAEAARWVADLEERLPSAFEQRGDAAVLDDVRHELAYALQAASGSEALATFQIWPVAYPVSVLCSVELIAGDYHPATTEGGRMVTHETEAPHLGPGTQYSIEQRVDVGAETMDVVEVHFVFSDGDTSLVFSLWPSVATVIAPALPDFALLKDSVGLRRHDGTRFQAVLERGPTAVDAWPVGGY